LAKLDKEMSIQERPHKKIFGAVALTFTAVFGTLALILGALSGWCATPAAAQGTDRTAFGSDLHIQSGEVVDGNASVTDGDMHLDGEVRGNVVVVNGNAFINGTVGGDVSVAGGSATLGPNSHVTGNVLVLTGGQINEQMGAFVGGRTGIADVPLAGMNFLGTHSDPLQNRAGPGAFQRAFGSGMSKVMSTVLALGIALVMAVFVLAFALMVPQRLVISNLTLNAAPGPSIAVGLISAFLLAPLTGMLMTVLAITVVGVALMPVLGIAVLLMLMFGLSNVSLWLGRRVYESVRHEQANPPQGNQRVLIEAAIGMGVLLAATLLPTLVLPGWTSAILWALLYFSAGIGLGAGFMSRFGTLAPRTQSATA
jgi:hypothetical protein